jgi:hypothetical protein
VLRVKTTLQGVTGSPYFNQLNFVPNSGTEDVAAANAAITAAKGFWTAFNSYITSACSYTVNGVVDQVDPSSGQLTGQLAATQQTGSFGGSGSAMPQEVQGLVRWMTGFYVNGRQLSGHTFIPSLNTAAGGTNGLPASVFVTAAGAAITALTSTPTTTKFVIWHRPPAGSSTGGVVGVASTGVLQPKFAVLRSRRD